MYTKLWMSLRIDVCIRTCSRNSRIASPLRTLFRIFQRRQKMPTFLRRQPIELLSFSRFLRSDLLAWLRWIMRAALYCSCCRWRVLRAHTRSSSHLLACAATTTISAHRRRRSISSRSSWARSRGGRCFMTASEMGARSSSSASLSPPLAPLPPWEVAGRAGCGEGAP